MPATPNVHDPVEPELTSLLEALPDPHLIVSQDARILATNVALNSALTVPLESLSLELAKQEHFSRLTSGEAVTIELEANNRLQRCDLLARPFGTKTYMVRCRAETDPERTRLDAIQTQLTLLEADIASALQGGVLGVWRFEPEQNAYIVRGEVLKWMQKDPLLDTATNADWANILTLEDRMAAQTAITEGLLTGQPGQCMLRLITPEGDKWVRAQGQPARFKPDGKPEALAGVLMDMTRERAISAKLNAYTQALERSHRELNRFSTMAGHDLQEPLRKISAFASLLRHRYEGELDADADHSLDFLVDAAGRMRSLIDDLLLYSNISTCTLSLHPVDLDALVQDVLELFKSDIQIAQAEILVDPLPTLQGDPTLLKHLFEHLISNALKFRRPGKTHIRLRASQVHDQWHFELMDDGIGFDEKFVEKIFAPFGRLHHRDSYDGNGVGLAICQQAVERHGGTITAESHDGEGARFFFTLPVAPPSSFLTPPSVQNHEDRPCG